MEKMTYEEALNKLKSIVAQMESDATSLDESVKLYEEGAGLAVYCAKCLEAAKQKVSEISAYDGVDSHE